MVEYAYGRTTDPRPLRQPVSRCVGAKWNIVLSMDDWVDRHARLTRKSYTEAWPEVARQNIEKTRLMPEFSAAVSRRNSIIVDQTNLTRRQREKWLRMVPEEYARTCVIFDVPEDLVRWRNVRRGRLEGKFIPEDVLSGMFARAEMPDRSEGFDLVTTDRSKFEEVLWEARSLPSERLKVLAEAEKAARIAASPDGKDPATDLLREDFQVDEAALRRLRHLAQRSRHG